MLVADVNVLVDAHRIGAPRHDAVRAWLDAARFGDEQLAIPGIVASAFVRTVTNRRVFPDPASMEVALEFIDEMRIGSAVRFIEPGSRHWTLFSDLCRVAAATGDRVPDAWLAALAIENRATLITADLGFGRYPGLRWRDPLAVSARSIRSLDGEPAATGTDSRVPGVSAWQLAADAGRERRTAASGSVSSATISAALLDSIVAWSLAGRPNEACGLIAGTAAALEGGSATRFLPLTNAAAS
ncbi:MAG: PIN domain-containing protein, partial [Chloroflexi bacterium]|nr:PIN domain-containing protein [Chloroflexota bacterium]